MMKFYQLFSYIQKLEKILRKLKNKKKFLMKFIKKKFYLDLDLNLLMIKFKHLMK